MIIGNSQEDYKVSSTGSESSNPPHLVSVCSYCITVVSDIHDTVARLHTSYTRSAPHLTSWHRAMTIPRHRPMHNLQFSAPLDHDLWSDSKLLIVRTASLICIWNLFRSGLRNRLIGSQLMVEWILNPYFSHVSVFRLKLFSPSQFKFPQLRWVKLISSSLSVEVFIGKKMSAAWESNERSQ